MNVSEEIAAEIRRFGIQKNDCLLLHVGMRGVINALEFINESKSEKVSVACGMFHDAIIAAVGPEGTICVPGYFYDYARYGTAFEAKLSPPDVELGAYSRFFFSNKMTHRGACPPVSLMATGRLADEICSCGTIPFGYGSLSQWERLVDLDAAMVFFGASINRMTFVHHVESKVGVPHLYNKIYNVPVVDYDEQRYPCSISSVRYLDESFGIVPDFSRLEADMLSEGVLKQKILFAEPLYFVRFREAFDFILRKLKHDPYYLLSSKPRFVTGRIPLDGATGPENKRLSNPN